MTISSENRKAGPFSGNGSTTVFPFTFKVFEAEDVVVTHSNTSGVEQVLDYGVHYSVTLNVNQDTHPGGVVTIIGEAPGVGEKLSITSGVPSLQPVQIPNLGGFYPAVLNGALDRLTILVQQLAEQVSRALKMPVTSTNPPDADALTADLMVVAAAAEAASTAASASASAASASASEAASSAASIDVNNLVSFDDILGVTHADVTVDGAGKPNGDLMSGYSFVYADGRRWNILKLVDGTLIQAVTLGISAPMTTAVGTLFTSTPIASVAWPVPFALYAPKLSAAISSPSVGPCVFGGANVTTTTISNVYAMSPTSGATCAIDIVAVGRWR